MPNVVSGSGPQPFLVTKKGELTTTTTISAGVFLKESAHTSGYVEPMEAGTDKCFGVSENHVYDTTDTNTLATSTRNVRVIVTEFVGYMQAEANTFNMGDALYCDANGRLSKTASGPVRAVFLGNDATVIATAGDVLGPVHVKLPNLKTSSSGVGWGNGDY